MSQQEAHISVMLDEVLDGLHIKEGGIYVDGTFGAGGYSRGVLERGGHVVAIDRDPHVKPFAEALKAEYNDAFTFIEGCFSQIVSLCHGHDITQVDGFMLDLGVSSMQLDTAERGFSFMKDGDLSMSMGGHSRDAKTFINQGKEEEIANIIYQYGDERHSRKIARAIVAKRHEEPITTTKMLSDIVCSVVKRVNDGIHPATKTFQAIRIWVNDELGELEKGLLAAQQLLKPNGRLAIVSFHSLEDRIVKEFLRYASGQRAQGSRYLPEQHNPDPITFRMITRKPLVPSQEELRRNIRSRSAKLRVAERVNEQIMHVGGM
ncbi:MAG: 16S rRNA (cytosine(1402)-N(4))-methyltransferase RsmH [Rickettsiales bacterium]|nr:16S rRNA (cytosine(1402)-N(4))-methyltransferase RsmH [Rickettsiales bacterium]